MGGDIMIFRYVVLALAVFLSACSVHSQILQVKPGVQAIVKLAPSGEAESFPDRLPPGTKVTQLSEVPRYYSIRLADGRIGWSYKGNFTVVSASTPSLSPPIVTKESLLARSDVLKVIIVDVEVGDATVIVCPEEGGRRDLILIDTGEDDADRIKSEILNQGFTLSEQPFTRFYVTHYDHDHFGDAPRLIPLAQIIYDHGSNNIKDTRDMANYLLATQAPGVDRRSMTLSYEETFSGGVSVECVAVNQATDFDSQNEPSAPDDNPNSIALLISWKGFDYFTGGDLTFKAEKSLAKGIKNSDVYHVNHHGSRATSSDSTFVYKLDPEVSVVSNGTRHGHPHKDVMQRLRQLGSVHFQTNFNPDTRAYQDDLKFIADDTEYDDDDLENAEGALGTIVIVVDPLTDKYYVILAGLDLQEGTFPIEKP